MCKKENQHPAMHIERGTLPPRSESCRCASTFLRYPLCGGYPRNAPGCTPKEKQPADYRRPARISEELAQAF